MRDSRVDADHSNSRPSGRRCPRGRLAADEQWATLHAADRLDVTERPLDGASIEVDLPNPAIVLVELVRV